MERCRNSLHQLPICIPEMPSHYRGVALSTQVFILLQDPDLTHILLGWVGPKPITGELCEAMSRSWPRLEVLRPTPTAAIEGPPSSMVNLCNPAQFGVRYSALLELRAVFNALGDHREAASTDLTTSHQPLYTWPSLAWTILRPPPHTFDHYVPS